MSEYIVSVPDEKAELFIARFGIGGTQIFGHRLVGEIVRCRDCREYNPELYRHISCELLGRYVEPDDFCSWSCRRSDKE